MRYAREHKAQTRSKLVQQSAALAKRRGFAASGVDALARSAGLTSGAFYKHFEDKDALLSAICEAELETARRRFAAVAHDTDQLLRAVDAYLSLAHVRASEAGCLLPALTAEVGRAPRSTRRVFERAFAGLVAVFAQSLGDPALASALLSQCVGAVTLARALASEAAQRKVLEAARAAARRLIAAAAAA